MSGRQVGNGDVPKIETAFATAYLFGSGDGAELIDRVEERIDALPGVAGLNLVRNAIKESRALVIREEGPGASRAGRSTHELSGCLVPSRVVASEPRALAARCGR